MPIPDVVKTHQLGDLPVDVFFLFQSDLGLGSAPSVARNLDSS